MDFERGKDPKEIMDIGLKAKAPIVIGISTNRLEIKSIEISFGGMANRFPGKADLVRDPIDEEYWEKTLERLVIGEISTETIALTLFDRKESLQLFKTATHFGGMNVLYKDKLYLIPEDQSGGWKYAF
jgi:hypothetical protein